MDGYEVLGALREDERTTQTPVVVLTAKVQAEDRRRCLGARRFLTKPFSPEVLGDALELVSGLDHEARVTRRTEMLLELGG